MKHIFITSLIILLFLVSGCLTLDNVPEGSGIEFNTTIETFEQGFNEVVRIDQLHKANFRKEKLGGAIVPLERIPIMIEDLQRLRHHIDPMQRDAEAVAKILGKDRTERDLAITFIDSRIEMLKSEEQLQLGYQFGNEGLLGDGFFCRERDLIFKSLGHFKKSVQHAKESSYLMDIMLTDTKEETWDLVGINDDRPKFYFSIWRDMEAQIHYNTRLFNKHCEGEGKDSKVYVDMTNANKRPLLEGVLS
jgi:hypothetical protein